MKRVYVIIILLFFGLATRAQSSQIKLYLQQIAANKVYIEYLQKGYKIVRGGLTTIGNIKNGHFKIDKDFFAALENINPKVRNYAKVAAIAQFNVEIINEFKRTIKSARKSDGLNGNERIEIEKVFYNVTDGCLGTVDGLSMLITASKLKMSDDERIRHIDELYSDMQDRYTFSMDYCAGINTLLLQRGREKRDAAIMKGFYNIQ